MDPTMPTPNVPGKITFMLQCGLIKDTVTVDVSDLNLKSLKNIACNFIDKKFPDHSLDKLNERLILFLHDYNSTNMLLPESVPSDITEGSILKIALSANNSSNDVKIMPHSLNAHCFKSPAFCDFCGVMIFGLVKQGLKCEGCGLSFHKRCANKIPNNCAHTRTQLENVQRTSSNNPTLPNENTALLSGSSQDKKSPFVNVGRPAWIECELAGRIRVPHTFVKHHYKLPTICQHCKKLLKGLHHQGMQCKDCKFNVHKRCMGKILMDCVGEAPKEKETSENLEIENDNEKDNFDDESENDKGLLNEKGNLSNSSPDDASKLPAK